MKFTLSMYYFLFFFAVAAYVPFRNLYFDAAGFTGAELGLIGAVGSVMGILTAPLLGLISDAAKDYRSLIKLSVILSAFVINGFLFTDYLWPILLTQVVMAIFSAPLMPIVDAVAVEQAPNYNYTYGQVRLWGAAGWTVMMVIAGYVFNKIGYTYIFPAYTILSLGLFFIVGRFPKLNRPKHTRQHVREGAKILIKNRSFIAFVSICMLMSTLITINEAFLPIYYKKLNYPLEFVTWNFAVAALVEIPMFVLVSKLIKRYSLILFMIIGMFTYSIKYFIMGFAPEVAWLIALQVLDGIALVCTLSAAIEVVNLIAPANVKATAQTLYGAIAGFGGIGGIVGNLVGGKMMDVYEPTVLFMVMGIIGFGITVLFLLFPNKSKYRLMSS